jgi:ribose transport system permease protein
MTASSSTPQLRDRLRRIVDMREFMIFYIIVLGVIGMAFAEPRFLSAQSLSSILLALSDQSIILIGMTILLVSGGFDLSVGSVVALSGAVTAIWLNQGMPVPLAICCGLGVGMLIGLINGIIIAEVGINPFITTLGMMSLARGLLMVVTDGQNISRLPEAFTAIGQGKLQIGWGEYQVAIQYPIVISIALVIVGDFVLRKTRFFRQNYYIGGNEKAALLSGINVKRIKIFNYMLTGFLAALAGIIITARLGSASTTAGKGLELKVISAVIIGGASLKGGVGTIAGSFLGALLLALIISSMTMLGVELVWNDFVLGATLLIAVMADTLTAKRRKKTA